MKIHKGRKIRPRRVLLYGQHGVGKSTWASEAPSPLFLDLEDGLGDLAVDSVSVREFAGVVESIQWLLASEHSYQTVVIDTVDWLEKLIHQQVASEMGKATVDEIGFGKWYGAAIAKWDYIMRGIDALRVRRGMFGVLLAHAKVVKFENPETSSYDRYELDLHKTANNLIQEWADEVLFASFKIFTRQEDEGFGAKRNIAVGGKERYIRTQESAAAVAKNRLRLPDELPMTWAAYAAHIPAGQAGEGANVELPVAQPVAPASDYAASAGQFFGDSLVGNSNGSGVDIAGLVVGGSSKSGVKAGV